MDYLKKLRCESEERGFHCKFEPASFIADPNDRVQSNPNGFHNLLRWLDEKKDEFESLEIELSGPLSELDVVLANRLATDRSVTLNTGQLAFDLDNFDFEIAISPKLGFTFHSWEKQNLGSAKRAFHLANRLDLPSKVVTWSLDNSIRIPQEYDQATAAYLIELWNAWLAGHSSSSWRFLNLVSSIIATERKSKFPGLQFARQAGWVWEEQADGTFCLWLPNTQFLLTFGPEELSLVRELSIGFEWTGMDTSGVGYSEVTQPFRNLLQCSKLRLSSEIQLQDYLTLPSVKELELNFDSGDIHWLRWVFIMYPNLSKLKMNDSHYLYSVIIGTEISQLQELEIIGLRQPDQLQQLQAKFPGVKILACPPTQSREVPEIKAHFRPVDPNAFGAGEK